jgi:hypothetical protein
VGEGVGIGDADGVATTLVGVCATIGDAVGVGETVGDAVLVAAALALGEAGALLAPDVGLAEAPAFAVPDAAGDAVAPGTGALPTDEPEPHPTMEEQEKRAVMKPSRQTRTRYAYERVRDLLCEGLCI